MKKILIVLLSFVIIAFSITALDAKQNVYAKHLKEDEKNLLTYIVKENLLTDEFSYEVISSVNYLNRYVLVELDEIGYLIYDRYFQDYSEFSLSSKSPFSMAKGRKVYFGPTYYYTVANNIYYDVLSNSMINNTKVNQLKKQELINIKSFAEEKVLIGNEELFINSQILNYSNSINTEYFKKLATNIGLNGGPFPDSCVTVAYGMILSYYDSNINDGFISEYYDVKSFHRFNNIFEVDISSFTESPGIYGSHGGFHEYLLINADRLNIIDISNNKFETNLNGIIKLSNWYSGVIGISITPRKKGIFTSKTQFAKNAIDNGYPVYISITGGDGSLMGTKEYHAIVGYDYTSNGIIANFGWNSLEYTEVNINNFTIDTVGYFEVNKQHSHSYNYHYKIGNEDGHLCSCNVFNTCINFSYYAINPLTHEKVCNQCFTKNIENHVWVHYPTQSVCSLCGYISNVQPFSLKND